MGHIKQINQQIDETPYNFWNGKNFLFQRNLFPDKLPGFDKIFKIITHKQKLLMGMFKSWIVDWNIMKI